MGLADLTFMLFGLFSLLRLGSYVPQIVRIVRDHNGASGISCACWNIWVCAHASTAVYAAVNLADPWLFAVGLFNSASCVVVVGTTAWKRRQWSALQGTRHLEIIN